MARDWSKGDAGPEKASQAEARYRDGNEKRHCSICTMFRPPASCTAVRGHIAPSGLCDYFEKK